MDIKNIGKIIQTICKPSWGFQVRLIILTDDYFSKKDSTGIYKVNRVNPFYIYDYTEKQTNETLKAVAVKTDEGSIMLTNDAKEVNNDIRSTPTETRKGGYAFVRPKNFFHVYKGLDQALAWLTEKEFETLFSTDDKGMVSKVTKKDVYYIANLGYNRHIMFKPSVVYDKEGNAYQGIELKSDNGHLASMTCEEYTSFYYQMKELMKNFNTMSFQLFSMTLEMLKNGGRGGS